MAKDICGTCGGMGVIHVNGNPKDQKSPKNPTCGTCGGSGRK
jgi:hypothetical protein